MLQTKKQNRGQKMMTRSCLRKTTTWLTNISPLSTQIWINGQVIGNKSFQRVRPQKLPTNILTMFTKTSCPSEITFRISSTQSPPATSVVTKSSLKSCKVTVKRCEKVRFLRRNSHLPAKTNLKRPLNKMKKIIKYKLLWLTNHRNFPPKTKQKNLKLIQSW